MKMRIVIVAGLAAMLGGCAAALPPVQVIRIHSGQPIKAGTVRIDSQVINPAASAESLTYTAAIANAMARKGFTHVAMGDPVTHLLKAEASRTAMGGTVSLKLTARLLNERNVQVWEGPATTVARINSPAAQPGLAAEKLANALFADFPGESDKTIMVP